MLEPSSPHTSQHITSMMNIRSIFDGLVCRRRFRHMNDGGRPATAALPLATPLPCCRRRQCCALTKLPPPPPSWPPPPTPHSHQAAATAAKLAATLPPPPPSPSFPSSSSLSSSPFPPAGAGEAGRCGTSSIGYGPTAAAEGTADAGRRRRRWGAGRRRAAAVRVVTTSTGMGRRRDPARILGGGGGGHDGGEVDFDDAPANDGGGAEAGVGSDTPHRGGLWRWSSSPGASFVGSSSLRCVDAAPDGSMRERHRAVYAVTATTTMAVAAAPLGQIRRRDHRRRRGFEGRRRRR